MRHSSLMQHISQMPTQQSHSGTHGTSSTCWHISHLRAQLLHEAHKAHAGTSVTHGHSSHMQVQQLLSHVAQQPDASVTSGVNRLRHIIDMLAQQSHHHIVTSGTSVTRWHISHMRPPVSGSLITCGTPAAKSCGTLG